MKKINNTKFVNDDIWIKDHFEEIVDKYAGEHIIVAGGEIFTGKQAIKLAKKKHPKTIPISLPVPRPDDFIHILLCRTL